jgi:hypothetical protein
VGGGELVVGEVATAVGVGAVVGDDAGGPTELVGRNRRATTARTSTAAMPAAMVRGRFISGDLHAGHQERRCGVESRRERTTWRM